jgi:POT family proton-dependent oligopeptide transporter
MANTKYLTAPLPSASMPPGIPYIVGNEAAERFSFYGMNCILIIFMTIYLRAADGKLDVMDEPQARAYFHLFKSAVYFFPIFGAMLSDIFLGKYRTIILLSIVYCFGHLALAIDDTRFGLALGLALIVIGSGGIKPCVSANVGDQFGKTNQHLLEKVFGWFYFSINLGAFTSTLITPLLLDRYGSHVAFAVPCILMLVATIIFWLGRHKFVHVPSGGWAFVKESLSLEGIKAVSKLLVIYIFVAMFWSLFDQTGSSWVLQARKMNLHWLGINWLPSQPQAANPMFIMILIPLFSYFIYPWANKVIRVTPLRKISIGFFVAASSFALAGWIQTRIAAGLSPSIGWQVLCYVIMTAAEVLVSITCLEFSYTQAPIKMKSFIMAVFMLSISMGNAFTAIVNAIIQSEHGASRLTGPNYYWFFTGMMLLTAVIFVFVAMAYRPRNYIQQEAAVEPPVS